jgi:DNA polymerase III delta prime subunit
MLENLIKKKVFPSPLILEGPDHEGLLLHFVKASLCETETACGECRSCKQIAKDFHPDWLKAEGSLKMEELREKMRSLHQKPFQSKRKVLSIQNFQEATANVQNALLKTLEEPRSAWLIIAGVNSRFGLLPTPSRFRGAKQENARRF